MLRFFASHVTAASLRTEMLDGRAYAVVPATIVVAGVLNNELVTAEELAASVAGWNGRPIPVRHPQDAAGNYQSSNDPVIIENQVVGQFFNAAFDTDRIRGEMWLDTEKITRLGGAALAALQRLEAGEVVEVSTGYFANATPQAGDWNGKSYTAVQSGILPDHIALLPDEVGACSVADGCGAGRFNAQAPDSSQSIMVAFFLRPEDAGALVLTADDLPEGAAALSANELHVTLAYLGTLEDMEAEFHRVASVLADLARYEISILAETGGVGRFAGGESEQDALFLLVDSERLHQFRGWLVDALSWEAPVEVSRRWGFIPHITLAYVPSGAPVTLPAVVKRQLAFDALSLSWGTQTITFKLQGELRADAAVANTDDSRRAAPCRCAVKANCSCGQQERVMNENEQEKKQAAVKPKGNNGAPAGAEGAGVGDGTNASDGANGGNGAATMALPAELQELAEAVRSFGGVAALMEAVTTIKANAAQERDGLVARMVANARCPFTADELKAKPVAELRKLAQLLLPADYSGQAGVALAVNASDDEWEPYVAPTTAPAAK